MPVLSDKWISKMAKEADMISPFIEKQNGAGVVSYGLSIMITESGEKKLGRLPILLELNKFKRLVKKLAPCTKNGLLSFKRVSKAERLSTEGSAST